MPCFPFPVYSMFIQFPQSVMSNSSPLSHSLMLLCVASLPLLHSCVTFPSSVFYCLVFPCFTYLVLLSLWRHVNLCQLCPPCVLTSLNSFFVIMSVSLSPMYSSCYFSQFCILFPFSAIKLYFDFTFHLSEVLYAFYSSELLNCNYFLFTAIFSIAVNHDY